MFSAFHYFETKELSLAGLCYILTMLLMCSLYYIADQPAADYRFYMQNFSKPNPDHWVTHELTPHLQAKDIAEKLKLVLTQPDMHKVSFSLSCDNKKCTTSFKSNSRGGKAVAKLAIQELDKLVL